MNPCSFFNAHPFLRNIVSPGVLSATLASLFIPSGLAQTTNIDEDDTLKGQVWQLQRVEYSNDETVVIPDPSRYTLEFGDDNLILLQADCNHGTGTYQQNESQLSLELGILTRVLCPPESFSDAYLRDLDYVVSYVLEEGDLYLSLFADGGILQFSGASDTLVGSIWGLSELRYADYTLTLNDPEQYTLSLDPEGGVVIKADCNRSVGSYTQTDQGLSLTLGPTTLAACPPESISDLYLQLLGQTTTYTLQGNQLLIPFEEENKTLIFTLLEETP